MVTLPVTPSSSSTMASSRLAQVGLTDLKEAQEFSENKIIVD